jgi:hypothetical protein
MCCFFLAVYCSFPAMRLEFPSMGRPIDRNHRNTGRITSHIDRKYLHIGRMYRLCAKCRGRRAPRWRHRDKRNRGRPASGRDAGSCRRCGDRRTALVVSPGGGDR